MSVAVVIRQAGNEPVRLTLETELGIDPTLVIDEIRNLAQEVRDVDRIARIVRFRIRRLEELAQATRFPENAERARTRAMAYKCWLYHLEQRLP